MKPKAFLVYGSEERHKFLIFKMALYLKAIGYSVQVCSVTHEKFWQRLDTYVTNLLPNQPLLLTYLGHGNLEGWENNRRYENIVGILRFTKEHIFFLNYTCHGAKAVKHLKQKRSPLTTGFVAPWDGYTLSYAVHALAEALEYWSRSKALDRCISRISICHEDRDINLPIQIRWGAKLDGLLFPKQAGQELNLLEHE